MGVIVCQSYFVVAVSLYCTNRIKRLWTDFPRSARNIKRRDQVSNGVKFL